MLSALAAVVADHGVSGATMERVASASGWTRGHVRHYLGNKDDQLRALVDLLTSRYASSLQDAIALALPGRKRMVALDTLFGAAWQDGRDRDDVVLDQLVAYETAHPGGSVAIRSMYQSIAGVIADAIVYERPECSRAEAEDTGFTLVALAYGTATMSGLGWDRLAVARRIARGLLFPESE